MNVRVRHVLFDCDGTLFETEELKARSWGAAVVALLDLESRVVEFYAAGSTTREVAEEILRRCRQDLPAHVAETCSQLDIEALIARRAVEKERIFDAAFPAGGHSPAHARFLRPEVWRLALAAKRDYPVGLVTTSEEHWVNRYFAASPPVDATGTAVTTPKAFFEPVICGKKKSQGVMAAVCEALRVTNYENVATEDRLSFVIFEDSLEGIRESKAAGIRVVAVPNDFTIDAARTSNADVCVLPEDLPKLSFADIVNMLR